MPARVRVAAAAVAAVAALAGMIFVVVRVRGDENTTGQLNFAATRPAAEPFRMFSEARVAVGSRCLRVLVASTPGQRSQGLREVRSLAPYDGMLFVDAHENRGLFTMAGTPTPLDITFFSSDRVPVDRVRMTPCPDGTDATCPRYGSTRPYRYALEVPTGSGGASASGSLGPCAA